jgi:NADPH-dependent ferric siderophore reductase
VAWLEPVAGGAPGDALLEWLTDRPIGEATRVWVAGEAAAVHRIRRHLFDDRKLPRSQAVVRGYWKLGRAGAGTEA